MGMDSNWLLTVVPNLHRLRYPFLVRSKNGNSVHQLCNFGPFFIGGIDSNLRPCVLWSVVHPPFRPFVTLKM